MRRLTYQPRHQRTAIGGSVRPATRRAPAQSLAGQRRSENPKRSGVGMAMLAAAQIATRRSRRLRCVQLSNARNIRCHPCSTSAAKPGLDDSYAYDVGKEDHAVRLWMVTRQIGAEY